MSDSNDFGRKAFFVRPKDIVRFFEAAGRPDSWLPVPRIKDLPEGYTVENVFQDHMRNCFVFVLSHPTWPARAEFSAAPEIEAAEWEIVQLDPGGFDSSYRKAAAAEYAARVELKHCEINYREMVRQDARCRAALTAAQAHPIRFAFRRLLGLSD